MKNSVTLSDVAGWMFALLLLVISVLNFMLVHPVPGLLYLTAALLFCPLIARFVFSLTGIRIPSFLKVILGGIILWFTVGISDLGDMFF